MVRGPSRRSRLLNNGCFVQFVGAVVIFGLVGGGVAVYEKLTGPSAPPPLTIGQAPATATGHVRVARSADAYGYDPAGDWPNACDLLTEQDIRAIFPQVTGDITRQPVQQDIIVSDESGRTAGESLHVPSGSCRISFLLPSSNDVDTSHLTVSLDGVGDPAAQPPDQQDPGTVAGGCTYRPGYSEYQCGWVEVSTSVDSLAISDQSQPGKSIDRFQLGSRQWLFEDDDQSEQKFEDSYLNPELIKAVLAKLPTS